VGFFTKLRCHKNGFYERDSTSSSHFRGLKRHWDWMTDKIARQIIYASAISPNQSMLSY